MTDTRVALASDRLPWLQDVPGRRHAPSVRQLWAWAAAVVLLVAGASYWMGLQRRAGEQEPARLAPARRTVTTPLPQPQIVQPAQQVQIAPMPQVEPNRVPEVRPTALTGTRSAPPHQDGGTRIEPTADEASAAETIEELFATAENESSPSAPTPSTSQPRSQPALASAQSLRLWPSRVTDGAYGRVIQIGAFGSRHQAKLGWQHMARVYPGVKRLPAVVVATRNSRGRTFYRFQIGTTSQAHSEVLCQRVQKIRFSCAVIGLPWKPKVER